MLSVSYFISNILFKFPSSNKTLLLSADKIKLGLIKSLSPCPIGPRDFIFCFVKRLNTSIHVSAFTCITNNNESTTFMLVGYLSSNFNIVSDDCRIVDFDKSIKLNSSFTELQDSIRKR